jgi:hypothetical protein
MPNRKRRNRKGGVMAARKKPRRKTAKLTREQERELRALEALGEPRTELGKELFAHRRAIILSGQRLLTLEEINEELRDGAGPRGRRGRR